MDEVEEEDFDYTKREQKIAELRSEAIARCGRRRAMTASSSSAKRERPRTSSAGSSPKLRRPISIRSSSRRASIAGRDASSQSRACFSGFLFGLGDAERNDLLTTLIRLFGADEGAGKDLVVRLLKLAPFKRSTWQIADELPEELATRYFAEAQPGMMLVDEAGELRELVDRLLTAKRPTMALAAVRHQMEKLDSPLIARLLRDLATTPLERDSNIRFQSYELARAFEVIDRRADVSADDLAHLEFLYLSALQHEKRGIPNLQRQLAQTPTMFVQAVGLVYKRQDAGEDPPEWHIEDEKARTNVATQAYTLLHQAKLIPGTGDDGRVDAGKLKEWIKDVRALCRSHGRERVGDNSSASCSQRADATRTVSGRRSRYGTRRGDRQQNDCRRHGGRITTNAEPLSRARRQTRAGARGDVSRLVQADRRRVAIHLATPRADRAELRSRRRISRHRCQSPQASARLGEPTAPPTLRHLRVTSRGSRAF